MIPGRVQLFHPFAAAPQLVAGRAAARSALFASNPAAGGARVLIGSAAGDDADDVRARTRGELLERVSNVLAGRAAEADPGIVASHDQLRRAGRAAVDPARLAAVADVQLRQAPMLWVDGVSLLGSGRTLVPAGAAFLQHRPPAGCTAALRAGSTGVAAHSSGEAAAGHALLEVLERDLLWRAWYGEGTRISPMAPAPLGPTLCSGLRALDLELTATVVEGPGGTACVVACLHTPKREAQSFGARALRTDGPSSWQRALECAVHEALMVRWSMDTPAARRAWERMGVRRGSARPRGALEHALLAFHHPHALAHLLGRAGFPSASDRCAARVAPPALGGVRDLAGVLAEHTGEEPVAVDTTIGQIGIEGMVVVRVVVPGAHRLPGDEDQARETTSASAVAVPPHPLG